MGSPIACSCAEYQSRRNASSQAGRSEHAAKRSGGRFATANMPTQVSASTIATTTMATWRCVARCTGAKAGAEAFTPAGLLHLRARVKEGGQVLLAAVRRTSYAAQACPPG